jgi:TonB family protein
MDEGPKVRLSLSMQYAPINRKPGVTAMLLSVFAHGAFAVLLALLIVFQRSRPVIVPPLQGGNVRAARLEPLTLPPAKGSPLELPQKSVRRVHKKVQTPGEGTAAGVAALRAKAKQETAALMQNFKFRTIYGFSSYPRYELPFQISGERPVISADELPPRFEQYLVVEVTIDSDGRVADARITAGEVEARIVSKVLAAVRQFKYRPATREGVPIPSQCDIVVHIPT